MLTTNQVFGWLGMLCSVYLAKKTRKNIFYSIGLLIYALSWGMLALGVVLAGPEGILFLKHIFAEYGWQAVAVLLLVACFCGYFWEQEIREFELIKKLTSKKDEKII